MSLHSRGRDRRQRSHIQSQSQPQSQSQSHFHLQSSIHSHSRLFTPSSSPSFSFSSSSLMFRLVVSLLWLLVIINQCFVPIGGAPIQAAITPNASTIPVKFGSTWSSIGPNPNIARHRAATASLFTRDANGKQTGKIFSIGGSDGNRRYNDVQMSADGGFTWNLINSNPPFTSRVGHSLIGIDDKLILMCGENTQGTPLADVWISQDQGVTWLQLHTSSSSPFYTRHSAGIGTLRSNILFFGGIYENPNDLLGDFKVFSDVWISSTYGVSWTKLTSSAPWSERYAMSVVSSHDRVYVLGGKYPSFLVPFYYNDVWMTADGVTWRQQTPVASWTPRASFCAIAKAGMIYVMGGETASLTTPLRQDVWASGDGGATWNSVESKAAWTSRADFQCALAPNRGLVIWGGRTLLSVLNDVYVTHDLTTYVIRTSTQTVAPLPYLLTTLTSPTPINFAFVAKESDSGRRGRGGDDDQTIFVTYSNPISLGFTFTHYGVQYTQIIVSPYGWLSFHTPYKGGPNYTPSSLPVTLSSPTSDSTDYTPIIAFFWKDCDNVQFRNGQTYYTYQTVGLPGSRAFVIKVSGVKYWEENTGSLALEVVLFEGTSTIQISYINVPAAISPTATATVGTQNMDGTAVTTYLNNRAGFTPMIQMAIAMEMGYGDACATSPCQNGGTCIMVANGGKTRDTLYRYACRCTNGFSGTNCETQVMTSCTVPTPTRAVFSPNGMIIYLTIFPQADVTNSLGISSDAISRLSQLPNVDCGGLLQLNSVERLGINPTCSWLDAGTSLQIVLGQGATMVPTKVDNTSYLIIQQDAFQSTNPLCYGTIASQAPMINLLSPDNPELPQAIIHAPQQVSACATFTVSGGASLGLAGREAIFTWNIISITPPNPTLLSSLRTRMTSINNRTLTFYPGDLPSGNDYALSLTVTNFLGISSTPTRTLLMVRTDAPPIVSITYPQQIYRGYPFVLQTDVLLPPCTDASLRTYLTYAWTVQAVTSINPLKLSPTTIRLDAKARVLPALTIPANTLQAAMMYQFTVTVTSPLGSVSASSLIMVQASPLVAKISGNSRLMMPSRSLTLSATQSYDPDVLTPVQYLWSCAYLRESQAMGDMTGMTPTTSYAILLATNMSTAKPCPLPVGTSVTNPTFTIPANTFVPGAMYAVSVTVWSSMPIPVGASAAIAGGNTIDREATTSIAIEAYDPNIYADLQQPDQPEYIMLPSSPNLRIMDIGLDVTYLNQTNGNNSAVVRIVSTITDPDVQADLPILNTLRNASTTYIYRWTTSAPDLDLPSIMTSLPNTPNLVVPRSALLSGRTYEFILWVTNAIRTVNTTMTTAVGRGAIHYTFSITPPKSNVLNPIIVTPTDGSMGYGIETLWTIEVLGFADLTNQLKYSYKYQIDNGPEMAISGALVDVPFYRCHLPAAGMITIIVYVSNTAGASTRITYDMNIPMKSDIQNSLCYAQSLTNVLLRRYVYASQYVLSCQLIQHLGNLIATSTSTSCDPSNPDIRRTLRSQYYNILLNVTKALSIDVTPVLFTQTLLAISDGEPIVTSTSSIQDIDMALNLVNTAINTQSTTLLGTNDDYASGNVITSTLSTLLSSASCIRHSQITSLLSQHIRNQMSLSVIGELPTVYASNYINVEAQRMARSSIRGSISSRGASSTQANVALATEDTLRSCGNACARSYVDVTLVELATSLTAKCQADVPITALTAPRTGTLASSIIDINAVTSTGVLNVTQTRTPIIITIPWRDTSIKPSSTNVVCRYYDSITRTWRTDGVTLERIVPATSINPAFIQCRSSHLTEFALFLHHNDLEYTSIQRYAFFTFSIMYLTVGILSLIQAIRITRIQGCAAWGSISYIEHILLLAVCIVRAALLFIRAIPRDSTNPLQHLPFISIGVLTALPFVFLFLAFTLLVFSWADLYHHGMTTTYKPLARVKHSFMTCNGILFLLLVAFIASAVMPLSTNIHETLTLAFTCMMAFINIIISIAFIGYGIKLYRSLSVNSVATAIAHKIFKGASIFAFCFIIESFLWIMSVLYPDALVGHQLTVLIGLSYTFNIIELLVMLALFYRQVSKEESTKSSKKSHTKVELSGQHDPYRATSGIASSTIHSHNSKGHSPRNSEDMSSSPTPIIPSSIQLIPGTFSRTSDVSRITSGSDVPLAGRSVRMEMDVDDGVFMPSPLHSPIPSPDHTPRAASYLTPYSIDDTSRPSSHSSTSPIRIMTDHHTMSRNGYHYSSPSAQAVYPIRHSN